MTPTDIPWFVVHTKPKCEHLAASMLEAQCGVEVYCPRIRFQRSTRRGKVWFIEALFPTYFFARFDPNQSLRAVRHSPNVIGVIEFGGKPVSVPEAVIAELREEMGRKEVREIHVGIKPGDTVELTEGPMRGFKGIVDRVASGEERVRILLEFLGRYSVVEVEAHKLLTDVSPRSTLK